MFRPLLNNKEVGTNEEELQPMGEQLQNQVAPQPQPVQPLTPQPSQLSFLITPSLALQPIKIYCDGDSDTQKRDFLKQAAYGDNKFSSTYGGTIDFFPVKTGGVAFQLKDSAGQERFKTSSSAYTKNVQDYFIFANNLERLKDRHECLIKPDTVQRFYFIKTTDNDQDFEQLQAYLAENNIEIFEFKSGVTTQEQIHTFLAQQVYQNYSQANANTNANLPSSSTPSPMF